MLIVLFEPDRIVESHRQTEGMEPSAHVASARKTQVWATATLLNTSFSYSIYVSCGLGRRGCHESGLQSGTGAPASFCFQCLNWGNLASHRESIELKPAESKSDSY